MQRRLRHRLEELRAAASDAIAFTADLDATGFATLAETDRRTWRALKNALAEIGEAVKVLPPELIARHPGVDWRGWAGLRDVVAHQYFQIDGARLQPAVAEELPLLLAAVDIEIAALDL